MMVYIKEIVSDGTHDIIRFATEFGNAIAYCASTKIFTVKFYE